MFCFLKPDNVHDDPVAPNKLNIKTDVKCDLGPSHCYVPGASTGKSVSPFQLKAPK